MSAVGDARKRQEETRVVGVMSAGLDVEAVIAQRVAEALRGAARYFEYDMASTWGGDTPWISTGAHVADLVAEILRDLAADVEDAEEVRRG